ncbi:amidase [Pelagibius sp. Alg239-R121]|uniref:amidase n=1 Tax=Pelagibius sp. Alg239-R121 TaxID=2993448 RepID=UPI0024A78122|nr:amidase [Pelagibius sp. Alg239-R121]
MEPLADLTASELRPRLAKGDIQASELVEACLARIEEREPQVEAWTFLNPDFARAQAKSADEKRVSGRPIGPLHGLPVGIKDIVDTKGIPTENGTPLDAGRRPGDDAALVAKLREAGAIIMGKTVTTELAYFAPGKTKNPHDSARTPGGSSSGSAAAVAAGMVPLAIGTQTTGSVIRPAAFCGVVGYKPTYGLIPRSGVVTQAPHLDTIGAFGRCVEDVALLAECISGFDPRDRATSAIPRPPLQSQAVSEPPLTPNFAFVRSPVWDQAEEVTKEAFGELAAFLGGNCDEVVLPSPFAEGHAIHRTIMLAELSKNFGHYYQRGKDQLSPQMCAAVEEGRSILAHDYMAALDWIEVLNAGLDEIFDRYDALITPAAPGEAPLGLEATGNPAFCALWTLCGTPAVTLPLLEGENSLPMGVQLIGPRHDDGRLLRTANWLSRHVSEQSDDA